MKRENMLNLQKDFPLLAKHKYSYLDNAATTQKPRQVLEAMEKYYQEDNANVHRGIYRLALRATMAYERAHEVVAEFIGAKFEEIIFTKGTTESINFLAYSLGKQLWEGDEIVLTEMEHHSNIVPWQVLAREKKLVLKYIPVTAEYQLDMNTAQKLITPKTKIVSFTYMSNVLGTINPVKELCILARKMGAMSIIDAAQAVAHLPINVQDLGCDFLAFSGHKMYGPTGIGVLYGRKELLQKMDPFLYGGDMIKEVTFTGASWNNLPWKFEAGTPPLAEAVGLAAAISYLQKIGWKKIQLQEKKVLTYALAKLQNFGVTIIGPSLNKERGGAIAFTLDDIHPHDVSEIVDRSGVCVRGGHHCAMPLHTKLGLTGSVRASLGVYNTKEDIDRMVKGLQQVKAVFAK